MLAQTNAAQQAVRRSVDRLGGGVVEPGQPPREFPPTQGEQAPPTDPAARKIDTRFVTPSAAALIVLRPAQLMKAPIAEMLPTEVASAAGLQYLGIDPADVDEVIVFVDQINPIAPPAYGVTVKFNKPFRAAALPPHVRPYAKLAELGGKKYLQSENPIFPSFYGPNSQTLVVAPDATLRLLLESPSTSQSGPILDRVREVPAGSDFYLAVDVASLRPLIQMGMAQAGANAPPEAKQFLEAPNLITAAELTLNLSGAGPMSLVVHANDETAAQQLESMMLEAKNKYQASGASEQPAIDDPVHQAIAQYKERISSPFQPQRNGASITCFYIDGQNPAQQQLMSVALIGGLVAALLPAIQAAREAARRAQSQEFNAPPGEGFDPSGGSEAADPTAPLDPGAAPDGETERR